MSARSISHHSMRRAPCAARGAPRAVRRAPGPPKRRVCLQLAQQRAGMCMCAREVKYGCFCEWPSCLSSLLAGSSSKSSLSFPLAARAVRAARSARPVHAARPAHAVRPANCLAQQKLELVCTWKHARARRCALTCVHACTRTRACACTRKCARTCAHA